MTPNEIISMSIAGVALIVAYLARLDSKKSAEAAQKSADAAHRANDLMARQLELATSEQNRQIQNEVAEGRPIFDWRSWGQIENESYYEFINQGALISNAKAIVNGGLVGLLEPSDTIAAGQKGRVKFRSPAKKLESKPFNFSIEFTDKLNKRGKIDFLAPLHPHGDWKRPERV